MNFEIVTDSSANLTNELIDRYGLHILSLRFLVGDREYYSLSLIHISALLLNNTFGKKGAKRA